MHVNGWCFHCSLQAPTDLAPPNSQGLMDDCQPSGWVEQRMLEIGRKLGLIANGQEGLLLSYLATVRDFESTLVKSRRKCRTATELSRLISFINYSSPKQKALDGPIRTRADESNPA